MSSILKVDTIQDQAGNNIINESGNVITIGASGDTITVPAGATVSGFTSAGIDDNATSVAITIDSSERVGIGSTAPGTDAGANADSLVIKKASGNVGISIITDGSSNANIFLGDTSDDVNAAIQFNDSANELRVGTSNGGGDLVLKSGANVEALRINDTGNVGIGVSSPSRKLQIVQDSTSAGGIYLYSNAVHTGTDTNALLAVRSDSNNGSNNGDVVNIQGDGVGDLLVLNNNGTDRVTVQADGKIAIGTTSHSSGANITLSGQGFGTVGADSGSIAFGSNTSYQGRIYQDNNTSDFFIENTYSSGEIAFKTNSSERMRLTNTGLGIGTASPSENLQVMDTSSNKPQIRLETSDGGNKRLDLYVDGSIGTIAADQSSQSLAFRTSNSERMRLTNTGLGIGTSSPSSLLHISGTSPQISFTETDQSNKQYRIGSFGAAYAVYDVSATQYRHIIDTNGNHIFNEGSQDCDFRIESNNNTHTLFVEGSSGNVGIGDTSLGGNALSIKVDDTRVTGGRVLDVHHSKTDTTFSGQVARFQSARNTTNGTYEFIRCAISGVANKFIVTDGGTIQAVNTTVASISDERIKQDIVDAKSQWDDIKALKFKNFKKKQAVRDDGDNALKELGVIAQDVESAGMNGLIEMANPDISNIKSNSSFGTLWTEDDEEVINGTETVGEVKEIKEQVKTVKYSMIWMKSVKALQEAMERIETLEAEVTALKNQP